MKKRISIADIILYGITLFLMLICLLPILNVAATSLSNSAAATAGQVGIFPVGFNLSAYNKILEDMQFWTSFKISVVRVVIGTTLNIFLVFTLAYPLSKSKEEFKSLGIVCYAF